jgi:hypothetical protein
MMVIRFLRSPIGLGYAYRPGETTKSLPDDVCKMMVEQKIAVVVPDEKPKRKPPVVKTAVITKTENTAVKRSTRKTKEK